MNILYWISILVLTLLVAPDSVSENPGFDALESSAAMIGGLGC